MTAERDMPIVALVVRPIVPLTTPHVTVDLPHAVGPARRQAATTPRMSAQARRLRETLRVCIVLTPVPDMPPHPEATPSEKTAAEKVGNGISLTFLEYHDCIPATIARQRRASTLRAPGVTGGRTPSRQARSPWAAHVAAVNYGAHAVAGVREATLGARTPRSHASRRWAAVSNVTTWRGARAMVE